MEISEWLDQECDSKATFEQIGELGSSVLAISYRDSETEIRIYPDGIKKLKELLDFIEKNELIIDSS